MAAGGRCNAYGLRDQNAAAYAQSAVKWAIATNLLLPTSGKLNAGADATRAEVAVAVARFHQQFVK